MLGRTLFLIWALVVTTTFCWADPALKLQERIPYSRETLSAEGWESSPFDRFILWYPGDESPQPLDTNAALYVADELKKTLVAIGDLLPAPWYLEFDVLVPADGTGFEALTGFPAVETSAAARSRPAQMIINWSVFRNQPEREQQQTLAHELLHLYVGTYCPVRPPLWLEEGLARGFSGEHATFFGGGFAGLRGEFLFRSVMGSLHPLEDLATSFPTRGDGRSLAYRQSTAVVSYFIQREFPSDLRGESMKEMLAWMTDPEFGPARMAAMHNRSQAQALDAAWRHQLQSPVALMSLFLQPTVLFAWSGLLAVVAWFVIRRRRRRRLAAMIDDLSELDDNYADEHLKPNYPPSSIGDAPSESR